MDLVDEQDIAFLETGQQSGQLGRLFNHRAARIFNVRAHRVGDDVSQGRLAQSGRAAQEHVFKNVAALFGRGHHQFDALADLVLTGKLAESRRPKRNLKGRIVFGQRLHASDCHRLWRRSAPVHMNFFGKPLNKCTKRCCCFGERVRTRRARPSRCRRNECHAGRDELVSSAFCSGGL